MAQTFSIKNYFKKIYSPALVTEFYKQHNITAIFEITEQTSRKNATDYFVDFYNSLSPEEKLNIGKILRDIHVISTKYAPLLFTALLKKHGLPYEVTQIECTSTQDKVLYYYVFHKDIFDEVAFFHSFYNNRGYMLYEAKKVDEATRDLAMSELKREFTRIATKEDDTNTPYFSYQELDNLLYVSMKFQVISDLSIKEHHLRIVYLPDEKEILISYTGTKYERLIFLDTFLRVVCGGGYEAKVESFNLTPFTDMSFDFKQISKDVPLLSWKVKNVTFSFGSEKVKKKIKFTLPSGTHEYGLNQLKTTLSEMRLLSEIKNCTLENINLSFTFPAIEDKNKTILVQAAISSKKTSLCPLFMHERFARSLLKQASIEKGFIEETKSAINDVKKKWEI